MKNQILIFVISALFSTIITVAYITKVTNANAGNDHYIMTPSECLTWALKTK